LVFIIKEKEKKRNINIDLAVWASQSLLGAIHDITPLSRFLVPRTS